MHFQAIATIVFISAIFMITTTSAAHAQQDHPMEESGEQANVESPVIYNVSDSNVQIRVSWQPEIINTDEPTTFTFEFLDSGTGERLQGVSYATHMTLDGKSVGHGHEGKAPEGIGTLVQQFDSMGSLSIIIDSMTVRDIPVEGFAQINLAVVPEFPIMLIGVVMAIAVMGSVFAPRIFFHRA